MKKTVLVTGANGQLGRAINIELAGGSYELYNTDIAEAEGIHAADITDLEGMRELFKAVKPYSVVNCAAYTAVDAQEKDVELSYKINALGPRNLSIAAREAGARLIHVSTDYVFPGDGNVPYNEFDVTAPKSVYGRTKLAGEHLVKELAERYSIIRTAWLYGDGKNFVKTMLRLSETHDEVSVVDDQLGNPTSTAELARAIHYLMDTDNYGTFLGTCEGITSWADFTEEIFSLAGKATNVKHVTTEEYTAANPASAPRPSFSALDNMMLRLTGGYKFADWHDAIAEYIKALK